MQSSTPDLPALAGGGCGPVSLDAAIAVLADAIERSPYKGQDNLLGMLAYMGKSPGDEVNRQAIAALLQNKQQPDARLANTVRRLRALGEVHGGMLSAWEFCEL